MNLFRLKQSLRVASVMLAIGTVVVAGIAVLWPLRKPAVDPAAQTNATAAAADFTTIPPLESFKSVWAVDLRKPLFDGGAGPSNKPAFAAKLAGTVVEPGFSQAMFSLPGGQTEMHKVGDEVAGAEVLEINADSAIVLFDGQRLTLKMETK